MRQMTLVGFLQAQNCSNFVGSWRHPLASQDFATAEWAIIAASGARFEAGKFQLGFFDDRLAMPDLFEQPVGLNATRKQSVESAHTIRTARRTQAA